MHSKCKASDERQCHKNKCNIVNKIELGKKLKNDVNTPSRLLQSVRSY